MLPNEETRIYRGYISKHSHGEASDVLFLTGVYDPLAEEIAGDIRSLGQFLSVRYFIAEREASIEELNEALICTISGAGEAKFLHSYSEITGYLWTDEEIKVGGHDLLAELTAYVGQFCHIEITYHREG